MSNGTCFLLTNKNIVPLQNDFAKFSLGAPVPLYFFTSSKQVIYKGYPCKILFFCLSAKIKIISNFL